MDGIHPCFYAGAGNDMSYGYFSNGTASAITFQANSGVNTNPRNSDIAGGILGNNVNILLIINPGNLSAYTFRINATTTIAGSSSTAIPLIVQGVASQTANLQEWRNASETPLSSVKADGSYQPASLADSSATNNSLYYSSTQSKLAYKDPSGTVNLLY